MPPTTAPPVASRSSTTLGAAVTIRTLLQRLGVPASLLPDLAFAPRRRRRSAAGNRAGDRAARGHPRFAAIHDQYAAALGTGAVRPGDVMFGAGTAWVLLAVSDQPAPPVLDDAFACTHVVEGLYGQLLSLGNGGTAFAWTLGLLGLEREAPEEIDRLMASVPAGSDGLVFLAAVDSRGRRPGAGHQGKTPGTPAFPPPRPRAPRRGGRPGL